MEIAYVVLQKLIVLCLLMGVGVHLMQRDIFTRDLTKQLSKLLTVYVVPTLFVSAFISSDFSLLRLKLLIVTILSAALILLTRALLLHFIVPVSRPMDKYAAMFSNAGFMGVPLATAAGGMDAVFFISGFILVNQMTQWTYGLFLITKKRSSISFRSAILNPAAIGTVIGVTLFCLPLHLPTVLIDTVNTFTELNTPLATLVLGTYFYKVNLKEVFFYKPAYYTAFLRLILTAGFSIILIWLLPIEERSVKLALTIASISPTALNAALLSQVYGGDYEYSSRLVLLTTMFSMLTIPVWMTVAGYLYL